MISILKTTNVERTPALLKRIDNVCTKIEQFAGTHDPDSLIVTIEVGRITRHHRKGIVYRAEINVTLGGTYLRAKAAGGDTITALDEARDEIERRLLKEKRRAVSIKHREGVLMKKARLST